jgi:cytochrome b6-f complex iron-sulfur subunit
MKTQNTTTIDRQEFFKLVGISVGAVILQHCLSGCSKNDTQDPKPALPINTTVNLNTPGFTNLRAKGGVVYEKGIIIARTQQDTFLAVSQACTHQGTTINFDSNTNTFVCPNHGSVFSSLGEVQKGPAVQPLTRYQTSFDATTGDLRIFS